MKNILILALLCAITINLKAQNTFPYPSSGNLGIGTTNPGDLFTVNGNIRLVPLYNGTGLFATDAPTGGNNIFTLTRQGNDLSLNAFDGIGFTTAVRSGLSTSYNMFINTSGNVGIGTQNPAAKFDVNGAIAMSGTIIHSTHNIPASSDGTYVIASGARVKGTYTLSYEGPDRVQTVVLLASGGQYDLNSSITILGNNSYVNAPVMSNFRFMLSSDHSNIYLIFDVANRNGGTSDIVAHYEGNGMYVPNWGGVLPASSEFVGSYPFAVNMGKVGIGTITPDTKLAVNGTIHAQAVKVDLIGWPDYVLKPAYSLKPLSEVKSYIDQNHHLPEMPSEKEVADKGVDLGEMNKLLTKKVEELTLYLIKQQDEIDHLKSKMNSLSDRKRR